MVFDRPKIIVTSSVEFCGAKEFGIKERSVSRGNITHVDYSMELADSVNCS